MKNTRMITATAIVVLLAGCGGTTSDSSTTPENKAAAVASGGGDASTGAGVYKGTCSSCHAPDARGLEGLGKPLAGSDFISGQSNDELVAFLKVGRGPSDVDNTSGIQMPPRGGNPALSDDDLLDVVAYLKGLR